MFQYGQGQDPFRHFIVFLINDRAGCKGGKIEPFALLHVEDRVSPGKGDNLLLPVFIRLRIKSGGSLSARRGRNFQKMTCTPFSPFRIPPPSFSAFLKVSQRGSTKP